MINSQEDMFNTLEELEDGEHNCHILLIKKSGKYKVDVNCIEDDVHDLDKMSALIGLAGDWIIQKLMESYNITDSVQ